MSLDLPQVPSFSFLQQFDRYACFHLRKYFERIILNFFILSDILVFSEI